MDRLGEQFASGGRGAARACVLSGRVQDLGDRRIRPGVANARWRARASGSLTASARRACHARRSADPGSEYAAAASNGCVNSIRDESIRTMAASTAGCRMGSGAVPITVPTRLAVG